MQFQVIPFEDAPENYTPKWVVEGVWQKDGVNFLAGPPKRARKSSLRRYLTACAIAGQDAFGVLKTTPVERVLSLIIEDHPGSERYTLQRILDHFGYTKVPPIDFCMPLGMHLNNPAHLRGLLSTIDKEGYDLVTLDPLIEFHGADENNATEMAKVAVALRAIANKAALAVTHHTSKPPVGVSAFGNQTRTVGEDMRGSGVLAGLANATVGSAPAGGPNRVKLRFELKLGVEPEPLEVEINNGNWVWSPVAELSEQVVLDAIKAQPGCSREDLMAILHRRRQDIIEIVKSLRDMKLVQEKRIPGAPASLFPV